MRRRVLIALLGIVFRCAAVYGAPGFVGVAAGASRPTTLACIGDEVVVHNPTDSQITVGYTFYKNDGTAGQSIVDVIVPHGTTTYASNITSGSHSRVDVPKSARVLGISASAPTSFGYTECAKTRHRSGTQRVLCIGTGFVLDNTSTDRTLSWQTTLFDEDGTQNGPGSMQFVTPLNTTIVGGGVQTGALIVQTAKDMHVVAFNASLQRYSECVKTK